MRKVLIILFNRNKSLILICFLLISSIVTNGQQLDSKNIVYKLPKSREALIRKRIKRIRKKNDSYIGFRFNCIELKDSLFTFSLEPWLYTYQYGFIYGINYCDINSVSHFNESYQRLMLDSKRFVLIDKVLYPVWFKADKYSAMGNHFRYNSDSFGHRDSLYGYYSVFDKDADTIRLNANYEIETTNYKGRNQHQIIYEPNNEIVYILTDSLESVLYSSLKFRYDSDTFLMLVEENHYSHYLFLLRNESQPDISDLIKYTNRFVLIGNKLYPLFFISDYILSSSIRKMLEKLYVIKSFKYNPEKIFGKDYSPPIIKQYDSVYINMLLP